MRRRTLGVISGGSGSSKFVTALNRFLSDGPKDLTFVTNVGDNFWRFGLYICPDIDIVTYSLAGILDEAKGWGIKRDTRNFVESYEKISGEKEWFNLGDSDLALSVWRTQLLDSGQSLTNITEMIGQSFGIRHRVLPASDDNIQTFLRTSRGKMHLQEFWVKQKGRPSVLEVDFKGIEDAKPSKKVLEALSDKVLILPANPVSSILPTLKLRGLEKKLRRSTVTAISPFIGKRVFSGPAPKFMRAHGMECNSFGVAKLYQSFLTTMLLDTSEEKFLIQEIQDLGIECIKTNIKLRTESEKIAFAKEIIDVL